MCILQTTHANLTSCGSLLKSKPVFKTIILFKQLDIEVSSLWHCEILP